MNDLEKKFLNLCKEGKFYLLVDCINKNVSIDTINKGFIIACKGGMPYRDELLDFFIYNNAVEKIFKEKLNMEPLDYFLNAGKTKKTLEDIAIRLATKDDVINFKKTIIQLEKRDNIIESLTRILQLGIKYSKIPNQSLEYVVFTYPLLITKNLDISLGLFMTENKSRYIKNLFSKKELFEKINEMVQIKEGDKENKEKNKI